MNEYVRESGIVRSERLYTGWGGIEACQVDPELITATPAWDLGISEHWYLHPRCFHA
jgi:hypothetical protein